MFEIMEMIREEFPCVEDYSISETSLEQVFISFAKNQVSKEKNVGDGRTHKDNAKYVGSDEIFGVRQTKLMRHLSTVSRVS